MVQKRLSWFLVFCSIVGCAVSLTCAQERGRLGDFLSEHGVPLLSWELLATYPHDSSAFTQGLLFEDGVLYESTGLYGASSLRIVELATGKVLEKVDLEDRYFAEGIASWKGTIIQLTWTSKVAFVYDKRTLQKLFARPYPYEGWGATSDGESLIVSDGSAVLRFLDPEDFSERRKREVCVGGKRIDRLNELEYAEGRIYANIWGEDIVVVIDPETGSLLGFLDLGRLQDPEKGSENVLNGIAYDSETGTFLVTGKRWRRVYRIRIHPTQ